MSSCAPGKFAHLRAACGHGAYPNPRCKGLYQIHLHALLDLILPSLIFSSSDRIPELFGVVSSHSVRPSICTNKFSALDPLHSCVSGIVLRLIPCGGNCPLLGPRTAFWICSLLACFGSRRDLRASAACTSSKLPLPSLGRPIARRMRCANKVFCQKFPVHTSAVTLSIYLSQTCSCGCSQLYPVTSQAC
jgi:hypothetical protein